MNDLDQGIAEGFVDVAIVLGLQGVEAVDTDGVVTFTNTEASLVRVILEAVSGSNLPEIHESNTNPTLVIDELNSTVTFCLAGAT